MENNSKLFIFCIGGTGARVLKSLTFLLAAGVDLKASKIIPIIIDPDSANGDVQRTIEVLKNYQRIHELAGKGAKGFFKTEIQTLASLEATDEKDGGSVSRIADSFRFDIDGTRDGIFRHFIGYDTMSNENRALADALYSDSNLALELSVGFKGNPHMGSVVLNQFKNSQEFKFFASRFGKDDRIFIVSSIFGGTGAAGFPLLVKNIREAQQDLSNHARLKNAPLGAITVAPYFGIEPDDRIAIDKNTFVAKTKAALEYYTDNLSGNGSVNALYYIGDDANTKDYKPAEGKAEQKNDAHALEMFAALSVVDFMNISAFELENENGVAKNPIFREYGIIDDSAHLTVHNLGPISKRYIMQPLTQYALMVNFVLNALKEAVEKPQMWVKNKTAPITGDFLVSEFFQQIFMRFNNRWLEWLAEMARNSRSLELFDVPTKHLHLIVKGFTPMKNVAFRGEKPDEWTYEHYNHTLNEEEYKMPSARVEQRFLSLFYNATEHLYTEKFKNLNR